MKSYTYLDMLFRLPVSMPPHPRKRRSQARRVGPEGLSETLPGLLAQFTQPLAVLLMVAAILAWASGTRALAIAVVAVILLNAAFAFVQERQAERAVEALAAHLPATARVLRDNVVIEVSARDLVPGDVIEIAGGDRICADARLIDGDLRVDMSALNGESVPAGRAPDADVVPGPLLEARELVFSGTSCTAGQGRAVIVHTGMRTEIGRIAALSQRGRAEPSPLERQVRRVTRIIAIVAVAAGAVFLPVGVVAGLGWAAAISFAIGLIVANVPEGLLPTITLALAVGVRESARGGVRPGRGLSLHQGRCRIGAAPVRRAGGPGRAVRRGRSVRRRRTAGAGRGHPGPRRLARRPRRRRGGLDDAALDEPGEIVFARSSPEGKLRVCEALRATGQVVAMTGDGVNDAPALRHAAASSTTSASSSSTSSRMPYPRSCRS